MQRNLQLRHRAAMSAREYLDKLGFISRLQESGQSVMMVGDGLNDAGALKQSDIGVAVIDAPVSPVQQRNLEKAWKCKVIDRTGRILEIFGERARTHEGRLQVELAALEYQRSRLVRSWTHLERQRGGFGFVGGPGESQLEIDRRLIGERIGDFTECTLDGLLILGQDDFAIHLRGLHR